jgi:muramidase (phage lysozyme)
MGMLDDAPPGDDKLKALYIAALMSQTDPAQLDPTMVGSFTQPENQGIASALMAQRPAPMQLSPIQGAVLDKIASGESPSYDTRYGGADGPQQFMDYSHHPGVEVPIPGRPGLFSGAAGRYMITPDTAKDLKMPDFSPPSQDRAAWTLANTTYRQKTGHDLEQDAQAGRVKWNALSGRWESLRGAPPGPP